MTLQNLSAVMAKVYEVFDDHPKCQHTLDRLCENSTFNARLKSLCKARWLQRIDACISYLYRYV